MPGDVCHLQHVQHAFFVKNLIDGGRLSRSIVLCSDSSRPARKAAQDVQNSYEDGTRSPLSKSVAQAEVYLPPHV